jgi:hypothetical protein
MPTVCIIYGFCEGPRTGERLQQALIAKGFKPIPNPDQADLIITHSGGAQLLPENVSAKQIIQVGPYWPKGPWLVATARKLAYDVRCHHAEGELRFWIIKSFWNFVYFWKLSTGPRMLQGLMKGCHWRHGNITMVVRPRLDSYCPQNYTTRFAQEPAFISFPGYHDDIWRDPEPYLDLLKTGK